MIWIKLSLKFLPCPFYSLRPYELIKSWAKPTCQKKMWSSETHLSRLKRIYFMLRISHREYLSKVLSRIASVYREGNQDFFRCLVKKGQAFHLVTWWLWPSRLVAFMLNELRLREVIMWKKLWKSVWKKWFVAAILLVD